jgi:hypothetical protein
MVCGVCVSYPPDREAESAWQAEATTLVKMVKAINAKNNTPALAYAA